MDDDNRVVVLIDMDCFYCQVEEKLDPKLSGKPIAVVQYNPWMGGGIIAVNYVARARGVTRHMRGKEAKEKCPDLELPSVPCLRGKADISKYRDAGKEVARVLQRFTPLFERASIDEAYLDITVPVQERLKTLNVNAVNTDMMPNTFALGYDCVDEFLADIHSGGVGNIDFDYSHATRLMVGAVIVSEIRAAVYAETGYRCSAGIAHNKILAKLVCGMNKPNKQTILPKHSVNILYSTLPVKKVKHLGGKFGYLVCEVLNIKTMGDLQKFSEKQLQQNFDDKNGSWLFNIARGIDSEPVEARFNPKSIGCCKNFKGKSAITKQETLQKWLKDLGEEIDDRLEKDALENNRTPKQMVVSYSVQLGKKDTSSSRSYNFTPEDELCAELFSNKALELLMESTEGIKIRDIDMNKPLKAPIKFLGISVGKFEDIVDTKKTKNLKDYFAGASKDETIKKPKDNKNQENVNNEESIKKGGTKNIGKDYLMQKFLDVCDKPSTTTTEPLPNEKPSSTSSNTNNPVIESTLEKQESFFAKMLNQNKKFPSKTRIQNAEVTPDKIRSTTPVCDVVTCGQDSNDTDYSGSTINDEINNSVALFEDDPQDVARVKSIRELLSSSRTIHEDPETAIASDDNNSNNATNNNPREQYPSESIFQCPECKKPIPIHMVPEHSDYHMALKLRDEERQQIRKEKQQTIMKTKENEEQKTTQATEDSVRNESVSSIASYLVKIDGNIPSEKCAECGKKIPLDKFGEHLDFHEAKKLSKEWNKKPSPVLTGSSVKRKRKSVSPVKKNKMPCRSIDSFFR